jgi:hypothetical protein
VLIQLLFLAGQGFLQGGSPPPASVPNPVVHDADVNFLDTGTCTDNMIIGGDLVTEAALRVSWSIDNPDDDHFVTQVLENGALVASLPSTVTHWDKTIVDSIQVLFGGNGFNSWESNWTYEIRVITTTGGVRVSSTLTDPWIVRYGTCSP